MSTSQAVSAIHHRANRIELAVALTLATVLGLLATLHHMTMPHWSATPIVDVADPGMLGIAVALAVVAAITTGILATLPGRQRHSLHWATRATAGAVGAATLATVMGASTSPHPAAVVPAPVHSFSAVAADRAALAGLMRYYDQGTGRWTISTTGWWSSANALSTMIAADRALGLPVARTTIAHTYARTLNYEGPQTTNHYYDDTLWWGLAWDDAYGATGDVRYLRTAQVDESYAASAWGTACGGGVPWAVTSIKDHAQLNVITNALYLELSADLYTRTHQRIYLDRARAEWTWLSGSGLIRPDGLLADHLDAHCHPVGAVWSYNQGTVSASLVALARATGDQGYLTTARRLANAATASPVLNRSGILRDPCEPNLCVVDGATFKGADMRGLARLNGALPGHPYTTYLTRQAQSAYAKDRMVGDLYGQSWAGPPDAPNSSRQASSVDLLTAVVEAQR